MGPSYAARGGRAFLDRPVGREFGSAEFDEFERQAEAASSGCDSEGSSMSKAAVQPRLPVSFFIAAWIGPGGAPRT